jgi:hypothetical protein
MILAIIKTIRMKITVTLNSPVLLVVLIEGFHCIYKTCWQVNVLLTMDDARQQAEILLSMHAVAAGTRLFRISNRWYKKHDISAV